MYSRLAVSKEAISASSWAKARMRRGAGEVLLGFGGDVGEHGLDALEAAMDAGAEVLGPESTP